MFKNYLFVSLVVLTMTHWLLDLPLNTASAQHEMTVADVEKDLEMMKQRNWGRWGKDDELGALNLITPEKRRAAAKLVQRGISVSLARNPEVDVADDNPDPFEAKMVLSSDDADNKWAVDVFSVKYHGYAHTHMDALCHLFYKGEIYNGYSQKLITSKGAGVLAIDKIKEGIFTRGVLIDIPRLRGVDFLEPRTAIYPEELDAWMNRAGIEVKPGDVVFVRTGKWARRQAKGAWGPETEGLAGLHASCGKWLHTRDIAMLGSDGASDVVPSGIEEISHPVHLFALHGMGAHIFDNCDLEQLAAMCEKFKTWEFLITASPIPVNGGTGSPLNPIATF
ncbi:MAG: cyclase family protein [Pirellulaceae bacterium]|nr:cyclase family protein [Pirellulaceae bacterium]